MDPYEKIDPYHYQTNPSDSMRRDKIISALGGKRFKRALDIGCGEGFITGLLPADVIEGYDPSPLAMSRLPGNVKPVTRDGISGQYDLIITTASIYTYHDNVGDIINMINKHASGTVLICHMEHHEDNEAIQKINGSLVLVDRFPYMNRKGTFTQKLYLYSFEKTYIFHNIGNQSDIHYHTPEQVTQCPGRLTFDGVYRNVYEHRDLIIRDNPTILYFIGVRLGGEKRFNGLPPEPYCTMEELKEMESMGCILGWHTWNHKHLLTLSEDEIKSEIEPPFQMDYFAYPYGEYDDRIIEIVKNFGFKFAHILWTPGKGTNYELQREML